MSFVRRQEAVSSWPQPAESGLSLRAQVVVAVGVDDEVAHLCRETLSIGAIGFVRVAQGIAAGRAIRECRPSLVALGSSLWRDERNAIVEAAHEVGAHVIDVPPFAPASWVAAELLRTMTGDALSMVG